MFNKRIHENALTSEVANRLFSNITSPGSLDQSFLATLRALLRNRLPQNETMQFTCRTLFHSKQELESVSASHCFTWFLQNAPLHPRESAHHIHIVYTINSDAGAKMLEIVKANAGAGKRFMVDFIRQDDLQVFYARKAKALFYTHNSGNSTIIFTDKLELKHFHALQMMIPKYLPRLFGDIPLTEMEVALLKSLGNKSAVEYEALIEKFAKDFDIRAEIIRSKLAGFETVFERMRADELRNEISAYQSDYEHYLSMMREISNKMQERRYTLAGLESAINDNSGDSELMEYFMCNKNLTIIQVRNTAIEFVVHGYADIYDAEAFERYVGNHNGYLYSDISSEIAKPQMEMLYRAIFGDGAHINVNSCCNDNGSNHRDSNKTIRYKLRICAAYRADMKSGLTALQHYMFPSESTTYFPNTHINHFSCIGTYAGRFQEYMQNRDYVGAIDQAVVSARNINFHDSTVMNVFVSDFSRTSIKCVERSDGTLLAPLDAIMELERELKQAAIISTNLEQDTITTEPEGDDQCLDPLF